MSTPTPLDSKIITLIVAMFDAAPGAEVLAELRSALTAGESVENLARNLVRTQVFQSLYPDTLDSAEFAARFAQNVLGEEVGFDQQAFATVELTAMQLAGLDRGQVVLRAIEALLAVEPTNPEWGNARRAFENKVIVAEYYSVEKGMSAQTLEALQTVLAPVTSSDRSTLSAIRIIDGLPPLPALTISGTITAGPVVADNGLTVTALSADGKVLGSSVVDANGNYSIALPSAYTGVVLLRVTDSNDRADYVDEATGEAMDLNIDLRAVAVADGRSDLVVNVTPATELVALGLGLAAGDNGGSSTALQGVTALQVASTQTAVQQALGLPENFVSAPVIPAVTAAGEPNTQANLYGNVLAAISGLSITQGRPVGGVLATLSPQVSSGKVSQVTAVDMVGAAVLANANGAAVGSALGMADNQANQVTTAWTNVFSDTTVLSTSDLTALGIPVSDNAQSAAQAVALVSSALRTTTDSAARSVGVLTGLNTAADNVVAAVNGSAVLTLTDLQTLGVRGITEAQVASVAQALTTLGVDRLPTTADELNTVAQQAVTVDGPNVDRTAPVFPDGAGKTVSVAEKAPTSTVVYDAQATDNGGAADAGITYRLSGTDAAAFVISPAGVVTLKNSANFEAMASYAIEVIAADAAGNTTTQAVRVNVINVNDAPSGTLTIEGTAEENSTLTAVTTSIADADGLGAFSFQWLREGSAISGATNATYTLGDADVGKVVSVRVDYTDARGTSETLTSAATAAVANVNDAPSGTLTIEGTAEENSTLTAVTTSIADADGLGSFSYQWLREGSAISGATNATYTLGDADVGKVVSVRVSYTDARGTAETLTSAATSAVANANNPPSGTLTIEGTAEENSTLTAVTTSIADADGLGSFSYQWLRDGSAISGATNATYTLGDADVGKVVSVRVSYTDARGTSETLTSAATAAVANVNDAPSGTLTIEGTAEENSTLTAVTTSIADADGLGAFSFQWLREGSAISGATNATYTLGDADVGKVVSVRVSYTDARGTAETLTSAATAAVANVNDAPSGTLTIEGTAEENSTLTAVTTSIADADGLGAFSYQWLREGSAISGATNATYTLGDADVGKVVSVRVSYTDGRGTPETLTSDPTASVADVFNPVIDTLRVAGDNIVNGSEQSATVDGATYQAITGQVRGTVDFDFKAGDRIVALVGGEGGTSVDGTVNADGSFSINVATTLLRDAAAKTVAVTLFSTGSGNTTPEADASVSTAYTVDLAAPTLTVASTLATDTGLAETISNNGLTKDNTVVLSGTAADTGLGVAKVQVYDGATLLGDATLNTDSGSWSFTTAALSDGTHALTAVAEDSAGNRSAASSAFSFTVDATGPTITTAATAYVLENASALLVPTGTDAHAFSWSLVAKEGDDFDKLHLEPGSTPDVRLKAGSLDYESGKTAYQFTLRATDVAGNATDKDFTVNVLDVPEVTVSDLRFGDGTDAVVNIAESAGPTITLSGKITATGSYESAQIAIYPADGDQPLDQPVRVNADGTFSVELDTELVLNDPGSVLAWTVTLAFVDSQGVPHTNVQTSGESGYVVDTTAPDASLASLSVTPDNTINAVEMTAAQAGGTVTVTGTVGGTDFAVGDTVTVKVNERLFTGNVLDETGRFSVEVDGSAIVAAAGADRSVTITISDAAGNTDDATTTFVVDITGPVISTAATQRVDEGPGNLLFTAAASDAGVGGVSFELLGADAGLLDVGSDGRITLRGTANLDHGIKSSYSFTLRASDSVGNHTDQDVTVTVVNVPQFSIASATVAGDNVINLAESTPAVAGQAALVSVRGQLSGEFAGARVTASGSGVDATSATVEADGSFEIQLTAGDLAAQATKALQLAAAVSYTNAAGTPMTAVANLFVLPYAIDTTAPVGALQGISLAGDNILNTAESTAATVLLSGSVSGEFTAGNTVRVTVGTSTVEGSLNATGHFSIPVNTTALLAAVSGGAGSLSIEVLATDAAGNSAPYTQTLSYTVDTTAPVLSAIAVAYSDATDTSATVSGSVTGAAAGADVLLQVLTEAGDTVGDALSTTLGDGGSFSVALPTSLLAGSYRVQATVENVAGNPAQSRSDLFTHNPLSVVGSSNTGTAVEDGDPRTGSLSLSALSGSTPAAAEAGSYAGRLGTLVVGAGNAWTYTLNEQAQKLGQDVEDIDTISVTLTDGRSISFALTVRGVNDAPTAANVEVDDVEEGVSSGFDLPLVSDPDTNDTATYSMARQARHGTVVISGGADYTYNPTGDFFGQDSFTYTVSDGKGGSNTYTVTLNVTDDGEPIVVSVSDEDTLTVTEGSPVAVALEVTEMVGTVSWSISAASASGFRMQDNFLVADSAPEFASLEPVDGSPSRQVTITVVATDERDQSVEKLITLLVANDALGDNQAPIFAAGATESVNVDENTTTVDTAAATDNRAVTGYAFETGGADNDKFELDADTGALRFKDSPNYEAPGSAAGTNSYTVKVKASDEAGNSAVQTVTVSVADLNDNAPVFTSGATGEVAENAATTTAIYTATTTDADGTAANRSVVYSLKADTGDVAALDIDSDTGVVTLKASADFETKASYSFTMVATNGSLPPTEQAVTVSVTDLNDNAPVFTNGDTGAVAENAATTTAIYTATTTDADGTAANRSVVYSLKADTGDVAALDIDADTGVVTLKASADYETKASYSFTVVATNGSLPPTEQAVTVNVTDLNDNAPAITVLTTDSDAKTLEQGNDGLRANGSLTVTDADLSNTVTASVSAVVASGTTSGLGISNAALLAMFSVTNTAINADPADAHNLAWSFDSGTQAFNYLAPTQSLVLTYTVLATDGTAPVNRDVTITITGTNDAPVPTAQTVSGTEDATVITGNLFFAEAESPYPFDPDGDALLVSRIAFASGSPVVVEGSTATVLSGNYGSLSIGADGEFEYTPDDRADALAGGTTANETFSYTVVDSHGATGSNTFTVALTGVNDLPIAFNDTNIATEAGGASTASTGVVNAAGNVITGRRGSAGSTTIDGTDIDPDSTLVVSAITNTGGTGTLGSPFGGSHGRLTIHSTGEYTYTPLTNNGTTTQAAATNALEAGTTSTDSFTYTLSDGSSTTTATLVITVNGSDDAIFLSGAGTRIGATAESSGVPVALDDAGTSDDDIALTAWEASDQNSANAWTYTASIGATDRHANDKLSMSWADGIDPDGVFDAVWNAATFTLTITAKSGVSAAAALADRNRVFAAVQFETGDDATVGTRTITYAVKAASTAGGLVSNLVTQTVDVTNDTGILVTGSGTTAENVAYGTTLSMMGATGSVNWTIMAGEDAARFSLSGDNLTLAAQNYEMPADSDGNNVYRVQVQAEDVGGSAGTLTAWINVQVTDAKESPSAANDTATVAEDAASINGNVITGTGGVDTDPDTPSTLSVSALRTGTEADATGATTATAATDGPGGFVVTGTYGTLTLRTDGSYSYAPNNALAAVQALRDGSTTLSDRFTYTLSDEGNLADQAQLTVSITGVNDAPVAVNDVNTVTEAAGTADSAEINGRLLDNDSDPDNTLHITEAGVSGAATLQAVGSSGSTTLAGQYGSLVLQADGTYSYLLNDANPTVNALTTGTLTDRFTYTVAEASGSAPLLSTTATLTVTIQGVDDPAVAVDDTSFAHARIALLGAQSASAVGFNGAGNVLTGQVTNASGTSTAGPGADSDSDSGTLHVSAIRSVTASGAENSVLAGTTGTTITGHYGRLTINQDGSYTYDVWDGLSANPASIGQPTTADPTEVGSGAAAIAIRARVLDLMATSAPVDDVFTYTLADSLGTTTTATLTVKVQGANDLPRITATSTSSDWEAGSGSAQSVGLSVSAWNQTGGGVDFYESDAVDARKDYVYTATITANAKAGDVLGADFSRTGLAAADVATLAAAVSVQASSGGTSISMTPRVSSITLEDGSTKSATQLLAYFNASLTFNSTSEDLSERTISITLTDSVAGISNVRTHTVRVANDYAISPVATSVEEGTAYSAALVFTGLDGPANNVVWALSGADADDFILVDDDTDGDFDRLTMEARDHGAPVDADGNNVYQITLTGTDTDGNTEVRAVAVTVMALAGALNDTASAVEAGHEVAGSAATGNVLSNDPAGNGSQTPAVTGLRRGAVEGNGAAATESGDGATFTLVGDYGSLVMQSDGGYTYTVDNANSAVQQLRTSSDTLVEHFNYTQRNSLGRTDMAVLIITVTGSNDAPVGADKPISVDEDGAAYTGSFAATDPEGTSVSYAIASAATRGTASITSTGALSYTPAANFSGTDSFSVRSTDADGAPTVNTVTVTVTGDGSSPALALAGGASPSVNENAVFSAALSSSEMVSSSTSAITWTLGSGDAAKGFSISGNNLVLSAQNYEALLAAGSAVLTATVTGENTFGQSATLPVSVTVVNANDAPTGLPSISGTVTEDQVLTAVTSSFSDEDGKSDFTYQWLRNGSDIGSATNATYTLGDADVGTAISVRVGYSDSFGSAGSLTSVATAAVENVDDVPTGKPTISGTVTEDQTLTASTSGIGDADGLGTFSFQWLRAGTAISGATSASYTLGDADVDKAISVQAIYTDGHSKLETVTSDATANVRNVNDVPVGVLTISGTATEDQTLTAVTSGISDADGLGTFSYQWLRAGSAISGATSATYTLGDSDAGTTISVRVNYSDGHGTNESLTSASTGTVVNVPDAPTITAASFSANTSPGPTEHSTTPISVSMSGLFAALSPADGDGNLSGLKVNSLVSGTLTVGGTNYTSAASVPTLTAASVVTWTPGTSNDLNGLATAFTVRAVDATSLTSTNVGNVQFNLTNVNDAPVQTLTDPGGQVTGWSGAVSVPVTISFADIVSRAQAQSKLSDGDGIGDIVAFRVTAVNASATFTINGVTHNTTSVRSSSSIALITSTQSGIWTPGTGVTADTNMIRVIAIDAAGATSNVNITATNTISDTVSPVAAQLRFALTASGMAFPVTAEEDGSDALAISDGLDPWANGGTDGSVQFAAEEALVGIAGWQTVGTFSDMAG